MIGHMNVTKGGGTSDPVLREKVVAESALETGTIRNRDNFQGDPDGIRQGHGGGDLSFAKERMKSQRKSRGGDILDSRKKNWGESRERGRPDDEQGSLVSQPRLIVEDAGDGENEVTQPVGQTQKVGLVGGGGGRNHKVTSG